MIKKISICIISFISFFLISCDFFLGDTSETYIGAGGNIRHGINYFPIEISCTGEVVKVETLRLIDLDYAVASDLEIRVKKVGGINKNIVKRKGGSNAFLGDYIFVDEDNDDGLSRIVTYDGVVVPETYQSGDFYDFKGSELSGSWHLIIIDWTTGTDGTFSSWKIRIKYD
jgi:hypothetical protein